MPKTPKVKPVTVTQDEANKMYTESPHENVPVNDFAKAEVNSVLTDSTFSKEASRVYRASVNNKRELAVP